MKDGGTAMRWGIGILVYLVIYFLIVFSTSNGLQALNHKTNIHATNVFGAGTVYGCGQPRIVQNISYSGEYASSLLCPLIVNATVCNATTSCAWTTECRPTLSPSNVMSAGVPLSYLYFTQEGIPPKTDAYYAQLFNNIILVNTTTAGWLDIGTEIDVSQTPRLQQTKSVCQGFGFTWYDTPTFIDTSSDFQKVKTVLSTMFGFDSTMCETGDTTCEQFSFYFSLLFVWIPTTALIICVYLLIPLI